MNVEQVLGQFTDELEAADNRDEVVVQQSPLVETAEPLRNTAGDEERLDELEALDLRDEAAVQQSPPAETPEPFLRLTDTINAAADQLENDNTLGSQARQTH
jgi:hypothetical protein